MVQIEAGVFDFNGTVENSEEIREKSIEVSLADFGRTFRSTDYPSIMKRVGFEVPALYISELYGIDDAEAFQEHWEARFWEIFERDLTMLPGVEQTIVQMRDRGLRLAIASSAPRDYIEPAIAKLELTDKFEVVVTRDDIKGHGKPDPEAFRTAAERLGIPATNCVAIGDTVSDVISAVSAGMKVIYVPGPYEGKRFHLESVVTLPSLENFSWNAIRQLEGPQAIFRERAY